MRLTDVKGELGKEKIVAESGYGNLREEDIRRIVQDETRGGGEEPPQAPIADPAPLGLAAFALTTFILSIANAGWLAQTLTFLPLALFYGGLVQLLAGMWEFRNNNTFGAVAFSSYGGFWLALAFYFLLGDQLGLLGPVEDVTVGFTLLGWTVFTLYMWIGTLRVNMALFIIFAVFMITLILLDIGFLASIPPLIKAGGYAGIILAALAWYTSAAGVLNSVFGRTVLPVGERG